MPRSFSRQYGAIAFIGAFSAAGLALFLWSMATVSPDGWYITLFVAFLAIVSEFAPAVDSRSPHMTLTGALIVFTLLSVGVSGAVWVACVDVLTLACAGRLRLSMAGFNVGQLATTVFVAGELWSHTSGLPIPVRLVGLVAAYYGLNTGLFVLGIRVIRGVPTKVVLSNIVGLFTVGFLAILLLGELSALIYQSYGPAPLALMLAFYILVSYMVERRAKDAATIDQQAQDAIAAYHGMIHALARVIDARDEYTFGHSLRVATLSKRLAIATGSPFDPNRVYFAGLLHDIGKIGLPDLILLKPDVLNRGETDKMMEHPAIGAQILADAHLGDEILGAVRHHHEWQNGNGYPDALHASQIPPLASIVGVADAFDAMASNRPYRSGLPLDKVRAILAETAGQQYDERLVAALFEILDNMSVQEFQDMGYGSGPPNKEAKPLAEIEGGTLSLVERFQKHQEVIEREVKAPRNRATPGSDRAPAAPGGGRVADHLGSFVEGTVRSPGVAHAPGVGEQQPDPAGGASSVADEKRRSGLPATLAERASLGAELDERLGDQGPGLESGAPHASQESGEVAPDDAHESSPPSVTGLARELAPEHVQSDAGACAFAGDSEAPEDAGDPDAGDPDAHDPDARELADGSESTGAAVDPDISEQDVNSESRLPAQEADVQRAADPTVGVPRQGGGRPRRRRPSGGDTPSDPTHPPTPVTPGSRSGR
ncbi:MAG: HD domain-containing protein [Firmicutes bacterium]|nr:HD domain-containing protein [Bacillota bacterium]